MRWNKNAHKNHAEIIREYYYFNKYYFTEQVKDTLIDAEEALLELSRDDVIVCHCNLKENAELIAKILDADADGKVYENHMTSVGKTIEPDAAALSVEQSRDCDGLSSPNSTNSCLIGECHADNDFCVDGMDNSSDFSKV